MLSESRSCFHTIQYSKDSWKCPEVTSVSAAICPSPISSLKWNGFHCMVVELVNSGEGRQSAPDRNQFLPPIKLQTRQVRSADNLVIFPSHLLPTWLPTEEFRTPFQLFIALLCFFIVELYEGWEHCRGATERI